jgi:uncharacterized protein YigE (DUF2233 family)
MLPLSHTNHVFSILAKRLNGRESSDISISFYIFNVQFPQISSFISKNLRKLLVDTFPFGMKPVLKYSLIVGLPLLVAAGLLFGPKLRKQAGILESPSANTPLEAKQTEFRGQSFDILKIDPKKAELRLFWKDNSGKPYGTFESLREALEKEGKKLRFATNAGIFSEDHTPGGLHIEDGNELKSLNLREGGGNFHMKPNGVFMLGAEGADVVEAQAFDSTNLTPQIATQSGPMLVIDGTLHPAFREGSDNKYIRNGVGVDKEGKIWFAISNERVNFFDFASLFRDELGCPDALYLDGSISGFYLPELDRNDEGNDFCGILAVIE